LGGVADRRHPLLFGSGEPARLFGRSDGGPSTWFARSRLASGTDDAFGFHSETLTWDTYQQAGYDVKCGKHFLSGPVANGKPRSLLTYHVTILPNPCGTQP
jgi:hypothetical protein